MLLLHLCIRQAVVEHRHYHDSEIAERQDRMTLIEAEPGALPVEVDGEGELDAGVAEDVFGDDEGYPEDAEGAEQGGLGYQ